MNGRHGRIAVCAAALLFSACAVVCSGCAPAKVTPARGSAAPQKLKPADARVQQQYYDAGLKHYSRENYGDARKAFQHVVDLGPGTALGQKAQDNLRKIEQILKTVEEIESK